MKKQLLLTLFALFFGSVIATHAQTNAACGGLFTDAAGPNANYTNNSDSTVTICPSNAGELVTVTFTSFSIEANWDASYVFNGNSIASPQISSTNAAANVPGGLPGGFWGTTIPGPFTSSSPDGCLTFRFRSDGSVTMPGWIANVSCALTPTCPKPTNLITSNVSTDSLTLGWLNNSAATSWEVVALPCGTAPTNTTVGTITTSNPFTFTGLNANTCYNIYVKALCSATDQSEWSVGLSSTTLATCPNPTSLTVSSVSSNSVSFGWANNSSATSWEVVALPCNTPISNTTIGTITSTNPFVITGLSPQTCYSLYVRAICSNTDMSNWSSGFNITTMPTCPNPTALVTSMVTSTSLALSWTNNSTATSWEVFALPCGSPAPTENSVGIVANTNPYVFTGLTPSTCYTFYVRALCSATDISICSIGSTATTQVAPPVCGGLFIDNGGINANYANSSDNTYTICPTNASDIVTVTFTAFNTETNWDALYVYDGTSITSPQISSTNAGGNVPGGLPGGFWGTTIPGPFTSSDPSGCLTFRFRSDTSVNMPGWSANVTCAPDTDKILLIAFVDQNNNGIKDAGENYFTNGSFVYQQNNSGSNTNTYSPSGHYALYDANPANIYDFTYEIQTEYLPYYSSSSTNFNDLNIPVGSGTQILYFPITLTQGFNDVTVSIIPLSPPRPGMTYMNKIEYKNLGVNATGGTITFLKPTLVTITTISQTGTVSNATGFTYAFTNLLPNETRIFYVTMSVPASPIVNLNDLLTASATISAPANDINLTNNSSTNSQIVVNSYDPNDKMESRGDKIPFNQFSQDDYLYYTVRFQNNGTANAIDVKIEDVLDSQIDEESIRMVSSSHNYVMTRVNNNLVWEFKNIQLVPSSVSQTLSSEYIYFKVKLNPGFQAGDIIPNTASIYFDSNPAIVTNTFNTKFTSALSNLNFTSNDFTLYPNPANHLIYINLNSSSESISKISFYDVLGKNIKEIQPSSSNTISVDVSSFPKGIYIVEITTESNLKTTKKLVIN